MLDDDEAGLDIGSDAELDEIDPDAVVGRAAPPPIERFHRTGVGMALAAGMFGLRDVLEPPKDETPAIVENWNAGEPFADAMLIRLDPDHPEDSIVVVRPWLKKPRTND